MINNNNNNNNWDDKGGVTRMTLFSLTITILVMTAQRDMEAAEERIKLGNT